jgi:hypothetical protein
MAPICRPEKALKPARKRPELFTGVSFEQCRQFPNLEKQIDQLPIFEKIPAVSVALPVSEYHWPHGFRGQFL